jgi:hypothetical protein
MDAVLVMEFEPWSMMQDASDETPIPKWRRYGKWSIFILKNKDFSLIDYEKLKKEQKDKTLLVGRIWEESTPELPTIDYCIAMMTNATKSMGALGKFEKHEYSQQWRKKYMTSMNEILQRLQIPFTINKILQTEGEI